MKRLLRVLILVMLAIIIIATPVLAYTYYANLLLVESNGNAYTMYPAMTSLNTTFLVNNGFIDADGLDTRVYQGATAQPHMLADDKLLFAYPLPANSTQPLLFTTGDASLASFDIITGYDGYVMMTDVAALEPGNNFLLELQGYVDTSYPATALTYIIRPDGVGTTTQLNPFPGGVNWQEVDEVVPDDDATYVATVIPNQFDTYTASNPPLGDIRASDIVALQLYADARVTANPTAGDTIELAIRSGGGNHFGAVQVLTTSYAYYDETWATDPATGVAWTWAGIDAVEIGQRMSEDAAAESRTTQTYAVVTYYPYRTLIRKRDAIDVYVSAAGSITATITGGATVTAAGVASGEHKVKISADGVNLTIDIDDGAITQSAGLGGVPVPGTAFDWYLGQQNTLPYYAYYEHTVGGVLIVDYEPISYIIGTTLPDKQGAAENGIIVWGANPSGVSIILGSLMGVGAGVGAGAEVPIPVAVTELTEPANMFPEETAMEGVGLSFIYPWLKPIADQTNTDIKLFLWLGAAIGILLPTVLGYKYLKNLFISGIICCAATGICIALGLVPFWFIFLAIIYAASAAVMERSPSF